MNLANVYGYLFYAHGIQKYATEWYKTTNDRIDSIPYVSVCASDARAITSTYLFFLLH